MSLPAYFTTYAEPDVHQIALPEVTWDEAISVPICGEESVKPLIESASIAAQTSKKKMVLLFVVNSSAKTSEIYKANNSKFIQKYPSFSRHSQYLDILLWDRHTKHSFPEKQGVGLARKIGADILSFCYFQNRIKAPFIHSSDADAIFSNDYFFINTWDNQISCALHPFEHLKNTEDLTTQKAIEYYDQFLKYHREGIKKAKSPYAYIPLGSNLTFSIDAYLKVRGFPKKEAGEDFYFLNKMAKVGEIRELEKSVVQLRSREGVRVPFGTNQSVVKIQKLLDEKKPYLVYQPSLYKKLAVFISLLTQFSIDRNLLALSLRLEEEPRIQEFAKEYEVLPMLEEAIKQRKTTEQLYKHVWEWMDAFRTLKFLHFVEIDFPKIPLEDALREIGE